MYEQERMLELEQFGNSVPVRRMPASTLCEAPDMNLLAPPESAQPPSTTHPTKQVGLVLAASAFICNDLLMQEPHKFAL